MQDDKNKYIKKTNNLKIPQEFYDWIRKTVLPRDRLIFYRGGRCQCALCGYKYSAGKAAFYGGPSAGRETYCPSCRTPAKYATQHSRETSNEFVANVAYLHKIGNDFAVRCFFLVRNNDADYADLTKSLIEFARYYFEPSKTRMFLKTGKWGMSNTRYMLDEFYLRDSVSIWDSCKGYHFMYDSLANLKGTYFEHYGATVKTIGRNPIMVLHKMNTWPVVEHLAKMGYDALISEIIDGRKKDDYSINLHQKKVNAVLGVPHSILLKFNHATLTERDIKAIKILISYGRLGQLTIELLKDIKCFLTSNSSLGNLDVFRTFSPQKVINYLKKSVDGKKDLKIVAGDFLDYRNECHKLGYDLANEGVMFPKDFYSAHSKTTAEVRAQSDRLNIVDVDKKLAQYAKFIKSFKSEMRSGDYVVRLCQDVFEELNRESETLHHCAHDYKERLFAGVALIYFVRLASKPDKSLYTLEYNVKTGGIVQIRGFGNEPADNNIWEMCLNLFKQPKVSNKKADNQCLQPTTTNDEIDSREEKNITELEEIAGRLGGFVKFINGNGYHKAFGVIIDYIPNKITRDPAPWRDGANSIGGGIYYSGIQKQDKFTTFGQYAAIIRPTPQAKIAHHDDRSKASEVLCLAVYKVAKNKKATS